MALEGIFGGGMGCTNSIGGEGGGIFEGRGIICLFKVQSLYLQP